MVHRISLMLVVALLLIGCASTTITTVKNPNIVMPSRIKVLVIVELRDLGFKKYMEYSFIKQFAEIGIQAEAAIDVLPPVKEYSGEEVAAVVDQHGITCFLELDLLDSSSEEGYVPPSYVTTPTYGGGYQTITSGGYSYSTESTNFEIKLYDTETGEVVWMATAFTGGDEFANWYTLFDSLAKKTVETLAAEMFK